MQRSAGAANTYGVELEKNIGFTTAIAQVTRESGSVIGNSLKSIYSRITSIQPAIDAMADIGINVKDSAGEMRDVSDILDDLGAKWGTLSAEQQQNLGLQIAGRFQLSRFLILMEQYDEALGATNTALNSAGSGYRENAEYLKSFEAQINMVKNSWTEAIIAMRDNGLGDAMITGLNVGLAFFNMLTQIIDKIGVFPTAIGAGSIALLLLSDKFRNLTQSLSSSGVGFAKWTADRVRNFGTVSASAKKMEIDIKKATSTQAVGASGFGGDFFKGMSKSAGTATVATRGLGVALRSLASVALPIAGFMALGSAISWVTGKISEQIQEQKELDRQFDEYKKNVVDAVSVNKQEVDELIDSYNRLSDAKEEGEDWDNEREEEYYSIQQRLGELFPSLIKHIDEKGRVHLLSAEAIEEEKEAALELYEAEQALRLLNIKDEYKAKIEAIDEYTRKLEKAKDVQDRSFVMDFHRDLDTADIAEENARAASEALVAQQLIEAQARELGRIFIDSYRLSLSTMNQEITPALQEQLEKISGTIDFQLLDEQELDDLRISLLAFSTDLEEAFDMGDKELFSKISEELAEFLEEMGVAKEDIKDLIPTFDGVEQKTDSYNRALRESAKVAGESGDEHEAAGEQIEEFGDSIDKASGSISGFSNSSIAEKESMYGLAEEAYEFADAIETLSGVSQQHIEDSDELIWQYEQYAGLLDEVSDAEVRHLYERYSLSEGTMELEEGERALIEAYEKTSNIYEHLLEMYPDLLTEEELSKMSKEEVIDTIKGEIEANDLLITAMRMSRDGKLTSDEDSSVSSYKRTREVIQDIRAEIAELQNLAKAYGGYADAYEDAIKHWLTQPASRERDRLLRQARDGHAEWLYKQKELTDRLTDAESRLERQRGQELAQKQEISNIDGILSNQISRGAKQRAEADKRATDARKKSEKATKNASKATKDAAKSQKDLEKALEESMYIADEYKKALQSLSLELDKIGKLQNQYPNWSANYRKSLQKEIDALKEKEKLLKSEQVHMRQQVKLGVVQKTGVVTTSSSSYTGKYANEINKAAQTYGIDPRIIAEVIRAESNFRPNVTSSAGAQGLMQLMPGTARYLGVKNSFNPEQNIMGGTKYLAEQLKAFGGDLKMALAAYNAGPGNVRKYGGIPPFRETQNYVAKITKALESTSVAATSVASANSNMAKYYLGSGFRVSSGFGPRNINVPGASRNHAGTDFAAPAGTDIKSLRSGKVVASYYHNARGHVVQVQQDDGVVALYQHMQRKSNVAVGQNVQAGQVIGKVGSTGASSGPHLHLEIKQNGKNVDPIPYLKAQAQMVGEASKVVAQTQQDIDGLQSDIVSRESEVIKNREAIEALQREIVNSYMAEFDQRRNVYDGTINYINERLQQIDSTTGKYLETLDRQNQYMEYKQTVNEEELKFLNDLIRSGQYSNAVVGDMRNRIRDLTVEMQALNNEIKALSAQQIDAFMSRFTDRIEHFNYTIEKSKHFMEQFEEGTAEWIAETQRQAEVLEMWQEHTATQIRNLQKLLREKTLNPEDLQRYKSELRELSLEYLKLGNDIVNVEKSTKDTLESMANDLIETYKSVIQQRQEAHMRALDEEMKAEDKRHNKVMENCRDELDAYRKVIQEKLDSIDKEESERDYNKEISELQKERSKLQESLNELSIDDSYEAKAERKRLREELDKIDETIAEKQHKREVDLRKENLNEMMKDKEEEISEKEKQENKHHESVKDRIDKEREYWTKSYEDQLNDERFFAKMREEVMEKNFDRIAEMFEKMGQEMKDTMPELEDTLDGTMDAVGTSIRQNIIDNLQKAVDLMYQINPEGSLSPPSGGSSGGNAPSQNWGGSQGESERELNEADLKVIQGKFIVDKIAPTQTIPSRRHDVRQRGIKSADEGRAQGGRYDDQIRFDEIIKDLSPADLLAVSEYLKSSTAGMFTTPEIKELIDNYVKRLNVAGFGFKKGGWTGDGGLGLLHEEEMVLNKGQTKEGLKFAELFNNISVLNKIASGIPNVPQSSTSSTSGDTIYQFDFHVDKMNADEADVKKFTKTITDNLKRRRGGRR